MQAAASRAVSACLSISAVPSVERRTLFIISSSPPNTLSDATLTSACCHSNKPGGGPLHQRAIGRPEVAGGWPLEHAVGDVYVAVAVEAAVLPDYRRLFECDVALDVQPRLPSSGRKMGGGSARQRDQLRAESDSSRLGSQ